MVNKVAFKYVRNDVVLEVHCNIRKLNLPLRKCGLLLSVSDIIHFKGFSSLIYLTKTGCYPLQEGHFAEESSLAMVATAG